MLNVAVVIGSLRKESFNRQVMLAVDKLNHPNLKFNILNIADVPMFNQDDEQEMPVAAKKFKEEIAKAEGVLMVTPEYNRSIPGVLKNVIDWGTRPYGQNVWGNKPIGTIGTSVGAVGTAVAQAHLRSILVSVGAVVLGQPEIYLTYKEGMIDDQYQFTDEKLKKIMQGFLDRFSKWVLDNTKK